MTREESAMTKEEQIAALRAQTWREDLRKSRKTKERTDIPRVEMNEQDAEVRSHNHLEVNLGLTAEQARQEAARCLDCANPTCIFGLSGGNSDSKLCKKHRTRRFSRSGTGAERNQCAAGSLRAGLPPGKTMRSPVHLHAQAG